MIIPSILHGTGVAVLAATLLIGSALQIGTLLGKAPAPRSSTTPPSRFYYWVPSPSSSPKPSRPRHDYIP